MVYIFLVSCIAIFIVSEAGAIDPGTGDDEDVVPAVEETPQRDLRVEDETGVYRFYGFLNKGLLSYDDGGSSRAYFPVDNWGYQSRFGIEGKSRKFNGWAIGARLELGWDPYSTMTVNQTNRYIDWSVTLRKAEIALFGDGFGEMFLGQGSMASDGTAEVDLSGTTLAGQSRVGRIAGGQMYRLTDGALSDTQILDTYTNMDGFGRRLRVRYDTPKWNGFTLSAAIGQTVVPNVEDNLGWDFALRYSDTLGAFKLAGAMAYSQNYSGDETIVDGSMSALHLQTGVSLTFAAGRTEKSEEPERYVYSKLGYQANWFEIGTTAFSVDAYRGNSIDTDGDASTSYGFQFAQDVEDWQTTFYLGLRTYRYEALQQSYRNGLAIITGAFVSF
ncbi:hypothetical protein AAFN47_01685 [Hoeflea sp. CAU 1731]